MVEALALGQAHPLRVNAPARVKHTTAAARLCCMTRSRKFWAPGAKGIPSIMCTRRYRCTEGWPRARCAPAAECRLRCSGTSSPQRIARDLDLVAVQEDAIFTGGVRLAPRVCDRCPARLTPCSMLLLSQALGPRHGLSRTLPPGRTSPSRAGLARGCPPVGAVLVG